MSRYKSRAFFASALALVFFLLVVLGVQVQVLGKARALGLQAARQSAAALILQNAQADLAAGTGEFADALAACRTEESAPVYLSQNYTAGGVPDEAGPYRLRVTLTPEPQSAGCLVQAELSVYYTLSDGDALARLTTARYLPGGEVTP